ncbi:MAG: acyltransferase family protein [Rubripirellula sp.]
MPDRLKSLDVARGIAAIAVIFWHWQHFFLGVPDSVANSVEFTKTAQPLYQLFGGFYETGHRAVMFFFVLSGFVFFWLYRDAIAERRCSVRKFTFLRFARLYPLHLATLLAVALLQWIYHRDTGAYFQYACNDFYHFGLNLVGLPGWGFEEGYSFNGPTWSVSMELGLYALFFAAAFFGQASWRKTLCIVVGAFALERLHAGGEWSEAVGSFFLGGLTFYFADQYIRRRTNQTDAMILAATAAIWIGFHLTGKFMFRVPLFPATIMTLIITELRIPRLYHPFVWIGDLTYSSYLLHFPLQLVFALVALKVGADNSVFYQPIVLFAFFAILMPISWLTFHFFERPIQSLLRNRFVPKQAAIDSEARPASESSISTAA